MQLIREFGLAVTAEINEKENLDPVDLTIGVSPRFPQVRPA